MDIEENKVVSFKNSKHREMFREYHYKKYHCFTIDAIEEGHGKTNGNIYNHNERMDTLEQQ